MGLQDRRASRDIKKATERLQRIKELGLKLSNQKGFTIESYEKLLKKTIWKMNLYNAALGVARRLRYELIELEKDLADYNERAYKMVITQYGRDSDEYAYVGGTRKSAYKKRKGN